MTDASDSLRSLAQTVAALFDTHCHPARYGLDHILFSAVIRSRRAASVYEGKLNSVEIADELKIGVWAGHNQRWAGATLEDAAPDRLVAALKSAQAATRWSDPQPEFSLALPTTIAALAPTSPVSPTMAQLIDTALSLEATARDTATISNVPEAAVGYDRFLRIVANSAGVRVQEENSLCDASVSAMSCGDDGRTVNVYDTAYGTTLLACNPVSFGRDVARETVARREPRSVASGTWPILFDAKTAAHLLATFWSIASGDFLDRRLTKLDGRIGEAIATPHLSIVDRATAGWVPHHLDGEGSPCRETVVIDRGVFRSFLHNRYTAAKAGTVSTGNADMPMGKAPGISPTNLSWESDTTHATQALLTGLHRGILIKELHGASASPISGDFSYGALGYWIENGHIAYPIADFTVAGNMVDLLQRITSIGNDLHYTAAHTLGSYGGRSLLVDALAVSGK